MAPPTENDVAECSGAAGRGVHAKRNKRKKELAKQRKAEAQLKGADEDDATKTQSNVHLEAAREPNAILINSKSDVVPAESLERNVSKDGASGLHQDATKVSDKIPVHAGAVYEIKTAAGKGLGMFAIKTIKQGTEILREAAIFKGSKNWWSKHAMFTLLSDEKKSQYMALHSQCNCGKEKCDETDFQKIWDANSFEVTVEPALPLPEEYAGPFVYLVASRINHDCAPNTKRCFTGECHIVFQANKDIQPGEEITTDYAGQANFSAAARRQWLLNKHQFKCNCQSCALDVQLSWRDIQKGVEVHVLTSPGLPVLGGHTAMEEQAFAEADIWYRMIQSKIGEVTNNTTFTLASKMQTAGNNSDITVTRVYNEKMEGIYSCVLKNDKYGLGLKSICLLVHQLQVQVALHTHEEFEAMARLLPALEALGLGSSMVG